VSGDSTGGGDDGDGGDDLARAMAASMAGYLDNAGTNVVGSVEAGGDDGDDDDEDEDEEAALMAALQMSMAMTDDAANVVEGGEAAGEESGTPSDGDGLHDGGGESNTDGTSGAGKEEEAKKGEGGKEEGGGEDDGGGVSSPRVLPRVPVEPPWLQALCDGAGLLQCFSPIGLGRPAELTVEVVREPWGYVIVTRRDGEPYTNLLFHLFGEGMPSVELQGTVYCRLMYQLLVLYCGLLARYICCFSLTHYISHVLARYICCFSLTH
jgi:hypothetical protein